MKQSEHYLENAENCAQLAERAKDRPAHLRYKRMEAAWRTLAEAQDWLDGEVPPECMSASNLPTSPKKTSAKDAADTIQLGSLGK